MFYCSKQDQQWLIDVLWKKKGGGNIKLDIEIDHGFKLFIHQRDFIAGKTIMDNILHGINTSRRVIFILSKYVVTCAVKLLHRRVAFLLCVSIFLVANGPFSLQMNAWVVFSFQQFSEIKVGNGRVSNC